MQWVWRGLVPHLKHLFDGCDAGDGIFAELTDAVAERTKQLPVDVDGTAAHASDNAGVLRLVSMETSENHIATRTERVS